MMVWAVMLVMMPYAMVKRKYDALASFLVLFGMLSLDVMIMLERINPDNFILVQVVVP